MPKTMTATQVIEQGEYLQPDFDPASLTIPQLLGVFSFHEVKFPSRYTKEKLVQTFNDTLKPRVPQLLQDRLSRQHSPASDHGITDGRTGRPIREASSLKLDRRIHPRTAADGKNSGWGLLNIFQSDEQPGSLSLSPSDAPTFKRVFTPSAIPEPFVQEEEEEAVDMQVDCDSTEDMDMDVD